MPMTKCLNQASLRGKEELLPYARCALLLVNVSRSVRVADGSGRAHPALRLSRSLPPLQISSTEPPKRGTRYGVIRLVEQIEDFQREVVDSMDSNLQMSKIIWPCSMFLS